MRMSSFLLVENLEDFTSLLNESFRPQPDLGADLASRNLLQFVEVERPRLIVQCNVNTKFYLLVFFIKKKSSSKFVPYLHMKKNIYCGYIKYINRKKIYFIEFSFGATTFAGENTSPVG